MSEDVTSQIANQYDKRYAFVRHLVNPKKVTPAALNLGIAHAKGEIIIRMDAHARIRKDYISKAVDALERHKADNVGGNMQTLPRGVGFIAKAIVASLSHSFSGSAIPIFAST